MNITLIVVLIIVALLIIAFVSFYNSLVSLRNAVQEGWSQIDVQLKRRADLIPNLIETVKGYASHEKEIFENVAEARSKLIGASTVEENSEANNILTAALGKLFAVAENYPQLRASENFSQLQEELSTTENKISFARQNYNSTVRELNTKIQTFPSNIVASLFKFTQAQYFEIEDAADREVPKVDFTK